MAEAFDLEDCGREYTEQEYSYPEESFYNWNDYNIDTESIHYKEFEEHQLKNNPRLSINEIGKRYREQVIAKSEAIRYMMGERENKFFFDPIDGPKSQELNERVRVAYDKKLGKNVLTTFNAIEGDSGIYLSGIGA